MKRLNVLVYKVRLTPQSKPKIVHRNRVWKYSGRVWETEFEDIVLRRSKRVRRQPDIFESSGRRLAEQGGSVAYCVT